MNEHKRSLLLLHGVVVIFGFTGILGKLVSIQAIPLVFWRMLIAAVGMLIYILARKRGLVPTKGRLWKYLGVGVIISAHWITFFHAIKVSNVSVTLACLSSASLFTALLEPVFYKRKIRFYEVMLGVLVIAGLVMIFSFETNYLIGILWALLSAFLAALFGVLNGTMAHGDRPLRVSFYEMIGGVVIITIYQLITGSFGHTLTHLSLPDLGWLLILGVVCTAFAFVASVEVMRQLTPFTVALTINLEPVYSIILALLIFGDSERMSGGFYAGAGIIILALFANALFKKNQGKWQNAFRAMQFWN